MMNANATYVLVTPPTQEPIGDYDALKTHLRVDTDADDLLLQDYIKAARDYLEKHANVMLLEQTWDLFLDYFPCVIEIARRPLTAVLSVGYYDADNVLQTLNPSGYYVDLNSFYPRIALVSGQVWPRTVPGRPAAVVVRFTGGMENPEDIDPVYIQALKLHVAHLYANREAVSPDAMEKVPMGYDSLVATERRIPV